MNRARLYKNVVSSLQKFVTDFQAERMSDAEYIAWDAHAQIMELPSTDGIGLAGVGLAEEGKNEWEIIFGVAVTTWEDPNLFRMTDLISDLFDRLAPETTVPVVDADTGAVLSWMVLTPPCAITPVGRHEVRAVQAVECRALLNPGSTSA